MATGLLPVALLFVLASCREEPETEPIDLETVPVQVVHDMNVLKSDNGSVTMRMNSPLMERFEFVKDSVRQSYELYTGGFTVNAYTADGSLETNVTADAAKHVTTPGNESWSAFGNVVITNYIKGERMTSDTIYWNQEEKKIHTDCYVKLSAPQGMMQGYGMESDEMARNAIILRPFDSFTVMQDSTATEATIDTLNIMGPLPRLKI